MGPAASAHPALLRWKHPVLCLAGPVATLGRVGPVQRGTACLLAGEVLYLCWAAFSGGYIVTSGDEQRRS